MQVFHAKVNLSGSVQNQVDKRGLTVPEIYILRRIHGDDAVTAIEHAGDTELDLIDERERLKEFYDEGLASLGDEYKTSVDKMFGGDFNPLPEKLRDFKGGLSEEFGELEDFQAPLVAPQENVPLTAAERRKARLGKTAAVPASKTAKSGGKPIGAVA